MQVNGGIPSMGYSSAEQARQARESLGKALEALQQDADIPKEVLGIAQNIAIMALLTKSPNKIA